MKYEHLMAKPPNYGFPPDNLFTSGTCFNIEVMSNGIILITDSGDNKGAPVHKNLENVLKTINGELGIGFAWSKRSMAQTQGPKVDFGNRRIFYMFTNDGIDGLCELSPGSPNTIKYFSKNADALKVLYGE